MFEGKCTPAWHGDHMSKNRLPSDQSPLRTSIVIFWVAILSISIAGILGYVAELLAVYAFCLLAVAVCAGIAIAAAMPWEEPVKKSRWIDTGIFLALILGALALFSLADHF